MLTLYSYMSENKKPILKLRPLWSTGADTLSAFKISRRHDRCLKTFRSTRVNSVYTRATVFFSRTLYIFKHTVLENINTYILYTFKFQQKEYDKRQPPSRINRPTVTPRHAASTYEHARARTRMHIHTHAHTHTWMVRMEQVATSQTCAGDKSVICKPPGAKVQPRKLENQTSSCAPKRLGCLLNSASFSTLAPCIYTRVYMYTYMQCILNIHTTRPHNTHIHKRTAVQHPALSSFKLKHYTVGTRRQCNTHAHAHTTQTCRRRLTN